VSIILKGGKI